MTPNQYAAVEELRATLIQREANERTVATTIHLCLLIAGFIREIRFIDFVNQRIGKQRLHHINRGEVLATLLLCLASGCYRSLLGVQEQIIVLPVSRLLGLPDTCTVKHFTRDVFSDALTALFNYGHEQFFQELVQHTSQFMFDSKRDVTAVVMDTTTFSTYHQTTCQKKEADGKKRVPSSIAYGHAKNHRNDLGQIIVGMMADAKDGIPLAMVTRSGNASDRQTFCEMAESLLTPLIKEFDAIRYVIGDSALCTRNSFDAVMRHGRFVITRVPDTFVVVRDMIKTIDEKELEALDPDMAPEGQPKVFKKQAMLFGHAASLVLVHNPNLSDQKKETLMRHAQKEMRTLTDQLKKRFKCEADALAHVEDLKKQCKYCHIHQKMVGDKDNRVPLIEKQETYGTRGRPSKEAMAAGKKLKSARAVCSVSIDEEYMDTLVAQECRYVLVCTDTELDARQILGFYKRNFLIESIWARLKSKQLSLESFYFKRVDRIEGLLTMMAVGVLAYNLIEAKLRRITGGEEIILPDPEGAPSGYKPTARRLSEFISRHPIMLVSAPEKGTMHLFGLSVPLINAMCALGKSWLELLLSETYHGFDKWITYARSIFKMRWYSKNQTVPPQ